MARRRRYWLVKSEPAVYSIHDLAAEKGRTTFWDGVRNYQARNNLKAMRRDDGVLFHHSNARPPGIVGTAVVVGEAREDATARDPHSPGHDPRHTREAPRWFGVDIRLEHIFDEVLTLPRLREEPGLRDMELLRKGSRLSVQPVTPRAWRRILELAGLDPGRPAEAAD